jgi:hypothetical protein
METITEIGKQKQTIDIKLKQRNVGTGKKTLTNDIKKRKTLTNDIKKIEIEKKIEIRKLKQARKGRQKHTI